MKYLFVLNNAFYLRNYGTVLRALAADGHDVNVAFTLPRPGDPDLFGRIFADEIRITLLAQPQRSGWWWAVADPIRALRDHIHYLQPAFDDAPRLVKRASSRVPRLFRRLVGGRNRDPARRRFFDRRLAAIETAIPPDPGVMAWLGAVAADVVFFSPLVELGYEQVHILKAAKAKGIATGHLVASWDNLSNKGRIQLGAERCIVWNAYQRQEAEQLHGFPADRVIITGAQLYDDWFERVPRTDRETFCAELGLDPALPIILYACSAPFIAPDETPLFRAWLTALRKSGRQELETAQVILRPHPAQQTEWGKADLTALGPVVLSPDDATANIDDSDRQFYFDTLTHAGAVIGINTSVFLEAGIVGTPCLTIRTPATDESQGGTLHFRYLVEGGLLNVADSYDAHHRMLAEAIDGAQPNAKASEFIEAFLRPHGIGTPAIPIAKRAMDEVAALRPQPEKRPLWAPLMRAALFPVAALYLRPRYLRRRAQRPTPAAPQVPKATPGMAGRRSGP